MMDQRLLALLLHSAHQQPQQPQPTGGKANSRLVAALRGKADAKYKSLGALPKYGEQQHAGSRGGTGGLSNSAANSAFQGDAFQDDAFQT